MMRASSSAPKVGDSRAIMIAVVNLVVLSFSYYPSLTALCSVLGCLYGMAFPIGSGTF